MTEINMNELDYNRDTALFFAFFFGNASDAAISEALWSCFSSSDEDT